MSADLVAVVVVVVLGFSVLRDGDDARVLVAIADVDVAVDADVAGSKEDGGIELELDIIAAAAVLVGDIVGCRDERLAVGFAVLLLFGEVGTGLIALALVRPFSSRILRFFDNGWSSSSSSSSIAFRAEDFGEEADADEVRLPKFSCWYFFTNSRKSASSMSCCFLVDGVKSKSNKSSSLLVCSFRDKR